MHDDLLGDMPSDALISGLEHVYTVPALTLAVLGAFVMRSLLQAPHFTLVGAIVYAFIDQSRPMLAGQPPRLPAVDSPGFFEAYLSVSLTLAILIAGAYAIRSVLAPAKSARPRRPDWRENRDLA